MQRILNFKYRTIASFVSFLVVFLVFTIAGQSPPSSGLDSIRAGELREKLTYISSEKFKGRGNGTPELNLAADYIAGIFEKNGLKPAGPGGDYRQKFVVYSSRLGGNNGLHFTGLDPNPDLKVRSDFMPEFWSASGMVKGSVELVEDRRRVSLNLKGKIAVIPEDRISSDDPEFPANAAEGRKLQEAGATAVIVVQNLSNSSQNHISNVVENFREDLPVRLTQMAVQDVPDYPSIPVIVLSSEVGRPLVAELRKPQPSITASLTVDVEHRLQETQNVTAIIEGSDASRRNEAVIVGAHYDHDGEAFGQIWYGADDNGSGTASILELAEAFAPGAPRPARSIVLAAWAGEEKGLLGSRYYVSHPPVPLNRTIAMFQLDMIGRNEEHAANRSQDVPEERASENGNTMNALGTAFSPELKTVISRMNAQVGLTLHFRYDFLAEDLMRRSDQWSFLQRGIPSIFFFSGLHPDYHTPRDTAEKINYPKLEKVTRLVYLTAYQLAMSPNKPVFVKATPPPQKPY